MLNASFTPKSFSNITGGHLKNIGSLSYANLSNVDFIDPPKGGTRPPGFYGLHFWYLLLKAMAPHSSTLAWKIPWTEEPGRLQSMRSQRVGHDWATSLSLFTFMHWRRKWQPTPVFLPGESQGRGTWWAAVYGVTQSRTRLKRLSRSSSSSSVRTNLLLL